MARVFAPVNLAIWQDAEWRALPFVAQGLYTTLWTHPGLSYCGVLDWRPGRIAAMSGHLTADAVRTIGECLQARHFIVVDEDTEECLIRSWARYDGLLKQPRMAISYANAYAEVASSDLRGVLSHEAGKHRQRKPDLIGWAKDEVQQILSNPPVDPKLRATPDDPLALGLPIGLALGLGMDLPPGLGEASGSVCHTPTPAPTPAPYSIAPTASRRKPERTLPETWQPNDAHKAKADELHVDLNRAATTYRTHALANDRRLRDWDQGFHMWLTNEKPLPAAQPQRHPDIPEGW